MEAEITHAMASMDVDYGDEFVIHAVSGRQIRCPAWPRECDYVRITIEIGERPVELAYWASDEWREAPAEVMGAIMGALNGYETTT